MKRSSLRRQRGPERPAQSIESIETRSSIVTTNLELKRARDAQELVSIRRDRCDELSIQGFVLHFSEALVLVQQIYDFHLDGLLLLRRADITSLHETDTDRFHKRLLREEGLLGRVPFGLRPPVSSYDVYLRSLPENALVILENELAEEKEFTIGIPISVRDSEASLCCFDGAGNWQDELVSVNLDQITMCSVETNYTRFYARHFARTQGC